LTESSDSDTYVTDKTLSKEITLSNSSQEKGNMLLLFFMRKKK